MKRILSYSVLILFLFAIKNIGQIAAWDVNGQTSFGTSPLAATTVAVNVTAGDLTRGSGVTTSGSATSNANSKAGLLWIDNSNNESGFLIFRASKPDMNFVPIDTLQSNSTLCLDNTVVDGKKYFYHVSAFRVASGLSESTNTDSVFFAMNTPNNFNLLQIKNQNKVKLTWTDNSKSELGYKIERKESSQTNFSELATVGENVETYTDESVQSKLMYLYRIKGFNDETQSIYTTVGAVIVNVESETSKPNEFMLYQNYPNPFNPSTVITFEIPKRGFVVVKVYDVIGKEIETLVCSEKEAGHYELTFNAKDLPSGIYFYQIQSAEFTSTKKMILIR